MFSSHNMYHPHQHPSSTLAIIKDKLNTLQMAVRHVEDSSEHLPEPLLMQHIDNLHRAINVPQLCMCSSKMFRKGKSYVYVLKLEDDCVYVGFSENVMERINAHFTSCGAAWTRVHKPMEVMEVTEGDKTLEKDKTLRMMKVHGWEKVRGSMWCKVEMKHPPVELMNVSTPPE